MFKIKTIAFTWIMILMIGVLQAQPEKVQKAFKFYTDQKLDSARVLIDQSVLDSSTAKLAQVWNLRGYIYKELYKAKERTNKKSPLRVEAVISFKRSILLDKDLEHKTDNIKNLGYIASMYYNDIVPLDTNTYKLIVECDCFNKYKEIMVLVDAEKIKPKEIEFNLVLGGIYQRIYEGDRRKNIDYLAKAENAFKIVLNLDPDNISANYNMGILFYNQGATLINEQDYDIDLVAFEQIQDKSKDLFKQSRPYMEKAYQLDKANESTIKGLCGIYFSLHETENYEKFKCKAE